MGKIGLGKLVWGSISIASFAGCDDVRYREATTSIGQALTHIATADADVTIREGSGNIGNYTFCAVRGDAGSVVGNSCLIHFPMPVAAPGTFATVTSAIIRLRVTNGSPHNYSMHRLVAAPFDEWSATWPMRAGQTPWQQPGAKGSSDRDAAFLTISAPTVGDLTLIMPEVGRAMIGAWINNPPSNSGVIISTTSTSNEMVQFASRQNSEPAYHPTIEVQYTANTAGAPGTPDAGTAGSGSF